MVQQGGEPLRAVQRLLAEARAALLGADDEAKNNFFRGVDKPSGELKPAELREALTSLGLDAGGKKAQLAERLLAAMRATSDGAAAAGAAAGGSSSSLGREEESSVLESPQLSGPSQASKVCSPGSDSVLLVEAAVVPETADEQKGGSGLSPSKRHKGRHASPRASSPLRAP